MEEAEFWELDPCQQLLILQEKLDEAHQCIDQLENQLFHQLPEEQPIQVQTERQDCYLKFLQLKDQILELNSQSEILSQQLTNHREQTNIFNDQIELLKLKIEEKIKVYQELQEQDGKIKQQNEELQQELEQMKINENSNQVRPSDLSPMIERLERKQQSLEQEVEQLEEEKLKCVNEQKISQKKSDGYVEYLYTSIKEQQDVNLSLSEQKNNNSFKTRVDEMRKEISINSGEFYKVTFIRNEIYIDKVDLEEFNKIRNSPQIEKNIVQNTMCSPESEKNPILNTMNFNEIAVEKEQPCPEEKPRDSCKCHLF